MVLAEDLTFPEKLLSKHYALEEYTGHVVHMGRYRRATPLYDGMLYTPPVRSLLPQSLHVGTVVR
jgi:hypothetical protein